MSDSLNERGQNLKELVSELVGRVLDRLYAVLCPRTNQ